jgi:hypothetical protein
VVDIYVFPFELLFGELPRFRIICGDFFGDLRVKIPFSPSGEGEEFPVAEFLREEPIRTSKCRKRSVTSFLLFPSSVLLKRNANGHDIHDDSL